MVYVSFRLFTGLNQNLELSEYSRQQLEDEIRSLNAEKAEIGAQLSVVSRYTHTVISRHSRIKTLGGTLSRNSEGPPNQWHGKSVCSWCDGSSDRSVMEWTQ